jgi:C_GCAxxG_C_C family probable redox protein
MNQLEDIAVANFRAGLNCAQAVLTTYSDKYRVDKGTALNMSCGFGGGMGRLQETCGAVTGSFMVIGLHICSKSTDNKERKEKTYSLIREFDRQFRNLHGTLKCQDLLKVDLKTPEGQKAFHDNKLDEKVCEKCIADSIKIIDEMIAT